MTADFWILFNKSSKRSALSGTGLVFGIGQIVVYPPFAAAMEPVAMVSLCSLPGSRRWTCTSINPGLMNFPSASMILAFGFSMFSEILVIRPFSI